MTIWKKSKTSRSVFSVAKQLLFSWLISCKLWGDALHNITRRRVVWIGKQGWRNSAVLHEVQAGKSQRQQLEIQEKKHGLLMENDLELNEHLMNNKLLKDGTSLLGRSPYPIKNGGFESMMFQLLPVVGSQP